MILEMSEYSAAMMRALSEAFAEREWHQKLIWVSPRKESRLEIDKVLLVSSAQSYRPQSLFKYPGLVKYVPMQYDHLRVPRVNRASSRFVALESVATHRVRHATRRTLSQCCCQQWRRRRGTTRRSQTSRCREQRS